jgi:hypothetical protein
MNKFSVILFLVMLLLFGSCSIRTKPTGLKHYPLDDPGGLVSQPGVQIDKIVSSDGNGSLKIEATGPMVIQLYNVEDIHVEDTELIYEAKLKTEGVSGQAYLEMWCVFKDKGEYFSRGFDSAVAGTTDWKTIKTVFNLRKGEMPDQIKLNVVVNGTGIVWIDDIRLSKI